MTARFMTWDFFLRKQMFCTYTCTYGGSKEIVMEDRPTIEIIDCKPDFQHKRFPLPKIYCSHSM